MRSADIDHLGYITHKRESSRIPVKNVGDMKYVVDIGLLEQNTENTQKQLDALSSVAKEAGLLINVDKTKSKNIDATPKIMLDEAALEVVDDFQYLGAAVNDIMKDFQHRRAKNMGSILESQDNLELKWWH